MSATAIVYQVKKGDLCPHPNADRLQLLNINGYTVIVGKDMEPGTIGIYFGIETPISILPWFLTEHDLYARHVDGKNTSKGYFPENGRVKAIRLRGTLSEGYFHVLTAEQVADYNVKSGEVIDSLNGELLVEKSYKPKAMRQGKQGTPKSRGIETLARHFDTPKLRDYIQSLPEGAFIRGTEKLHGTSGRTGRVQRLPTWFDGILSRFGLKRSLWTLQTGTRRTLTIDEVSGYGNEYDYHGSSGYRKFWHDRLNAKGIAEGLTVYYEIVGFTDEGSAIMGTHQDGPITLTYNYGLDQGSHDIYVYRITQEAVDGSIIEIPYEQMARWCEARELNVVPSMLEIVYDGDYMSLIKQLEDLCNWVEGVRGHPCEGIVLEVMHPKWTTGGGKRYLKYKSQKFCELENIAYSTTGFVDIEEES